MEAFCRPGAVSPNLASWKRNRGSGTSVHQGFVCSSMAGAGPGAGLSAARINAKGQFFQTGGSVHAPALDAAVPPATLR